jgi:hypothetical protein
VSQVKTISSSVILSSELLCAEDSYCLSIELTDCLQLTALEILGLDLPAKNRVEALLQKEFLTDNQLSELACDFAEHTLKVFEEYCPSDPRPRKLVEIARLYHAGAESKEMIKKAFMETWRAIEGFNDRMYRAAFAAGLAASLLYSDDVDKMARNVALWAQKAVHVKQWESRKSNFELMIGKEKEAVWQLSQIVKKLCR